MMIFLMCNKIVIFQIHKPTVALEGLNKNSLLEKYQQTLKILT